MAFINTLQEEISVIHKWLQHAAKTPQTKSFLFLSWAMNVLTCICLICNRPRLPRMNLMNRWASRHLRPHLIYLNTVLEGCSSSRNGAHWQRSQRCVMRSTGASVASPGTKQVSLDSVLGLSCVWPPPSPATTVGFAHHCVTSHFFALLGFLEATLPQWSWEHILFQRMSPRNKHWRLKDSSHSQDPRQVSHHMTSC